MQRHASGRPASGRTQRAVGGRRRQLRGVLGALARVDTEEPVFSVCLDDSPTEEQWLEVTEITVGLRTDRLDALRHVGYYAFNRAWNPSGYGGARLEPQPEPRSVAGFEDAESVLADALAAAGCEDRARVVLNEVARRLHSEDWGVVRDQPFVAFVLDDQFAHDLLENLHASVPPSTAARLKAAARRDRRSGHRMMATRATAIVTCALVVAGCGSDALSGATHDRAQAACRQFLADADPYLFGVGCRPAR
jgi:hypothetical protein